MGVYINPKGGSKEDWLVQHGELILSKPGSALFTVLQRRGEVIVCWVDNGYMASAGVAFSADELMIFADPSDRRPKKWFSVPKDLVIDPLVIGEGNVKWMRDRGW